MNDVAQSNLALYWLQKRITLYSIWRPWLLLECGFLAPTGARSDVYLSSGEFSWHVRSYMHSFFVRFLNNQSPISELLIMFKVGENLKEWSGFIHNKTLFCSRSHQLWSSPVSIWHQGFCKVIVYIFNGIDQIYTNSSVLELALTHRHPEDS